MIHRVYQVIKRDGCVVSFDLRKISQAINAAYQEKRKIDREYEEIMARFLEAEEEIYREILKRVEESKKQIKRFILVLLCSMSAFLRDWWLKRNAYAGRSNTSAVSDKMLLTIPTPPTAVAAIGSLRRGGVLCADLG